MALDSVQLILEGLRQHSQRQFQQQGLAQQKEAETARQKADEEDRKARVQQAQDRLKEDQRQFDISAKAAKAINDLRMLNETQKVTEGILKGVPVPGATVKPAAPMTTSGLPTMENLNQANQYSQDYQTHTLPVMGSNDQPLSVTLPNREVFAKQQADVERIGRAPEEEFKMKQAAGVEAARIRAIQEGKGEDFARAMMQKQFDDARAADTQRAENWRAQLRANTDLQVAKMRKDAGSTSSIDLTPYAQDALDGKITKEDINRLPLKAPEKMKIIDAVRQQGAGILSKDQFELVNDFPQIINTLKYMDEIIDTQYKTGNKVTATLGGIAQHLNPNDTATTTAVKELKARSSVTSRFLREKGNLSNRDVERVMGMFTSEFNPIDVNIKLRDDFRNELEGLLDARLGNLPVEQRNIIKKRVGIWDIKPRMGSKPKATTPVDPKVDAELKRLGIQ